MLDFNSANQGYKPNCDDSSVFWNNMIQNPASPPPGYFQTASPPIFHFCLQSPYLGSGSLTVSAVFIVLYLEGAGTVSGNFSDFSTSGPETVYSFSNQPFVGGTPPGGTYASCQSVEINSTSTPAGVNPPFGILHPGDYLLANFSFTITGNVGASPTFCTGSDPTAGSKESLIQIAGTPSIPSPEFPIGTLLSVSAPLAGIAAYMIISMRLKKPPSIISNHIQGLGQADLDRLKI